MMLVLLLFQIHYECYAFALEHTLAALLVQRRDTLHCSMELVMENVCNITFHKYHRSNFNFHQSQQLRR